VYDSTHVAIADFRRLALISTGEPVDRDTLSAKRLRRSKAIGALGDNQAKNEQSTSVMFPTSY